jgi:hypothetical protein
VTLSILLDGMLAVLLGTTIIYAAILNRKLKQLRQGETEMKALLKEFNSSAAKAEANLGQMKLMAGQAMTARGADGPGELAALREELERGHALKDDLGFLVDRGEALADRLAKAISEARDAARPRAPVNLSAVPLPMPQAMKTSDAAKTPKAASAPVAPATPRKAGAPSVAERELLKALRAARPER